MNDHPQYRWTLTVAPLRKRLKEKKKTECNPPSLCLLLKDFIIVLPTQNWDYCPRIIRPGLPWAICDGRRASLSEISMRIRTPSNFNLPEIKLT